MCGCCSSLKLPSAPHHPGTLATAGFITKCQTTRAKLLEPMPGGAITHPPKVWRIVRLDVAVDRSTPKLQRRQRRTSCSSYDWRVCATDLHCSRAMPPNTHLSFSSARDAVICVSEFTSSHTMCKWQRRFGYLIKTLKGEDADHKFVLSWLLLRCKYFEPSRKGRERLILPLSLRLFKKHKCIEYEKSKAG